MTLRPLGWIDARVTGYFGSSVSSALRQPSSISSRFGRRGLAVEQVLRRLVEEHGHPALPLGGVLSAITYS